MIYLLRNSMYLSALIIPKPKILQFLISTNYTFVEPYYLMPKIIVLWTLQNIMFEWHHTNSNAFVETC
jgi:hypothetical protein